MAIALFILLDVARKGEHSGRGPQTTLTAAISMLGRSALSPSPSVADQQRTVWDLWLATPIAFYGKVVDEKGSPVAGANIDVSFTDHLMDGNTEEQLTTDDSGLFYAKGHGLGIDVMASKPGYYHLNASDGSFAYVREAGHFDPHNNPDSPAILVLRKAGKVEPLVVQGIGGWLEKDGTEVDIDLRTGQHTPPGRGDIKLELWSDHRGEDSEYPFNWRFRITASGPGFVERTGEFDFVAPTSGYRQSIEIDMAKSLGSKWASSITKDYFVKLADGTYARLHLNVGATEGCTFAGVAYINPQVGSRNLEEGKDEDDDL